MESRALRRPWTEIFRPKSLDEVILKKSQRETLEDWWRKWVVWWNMRRIWNMNYRSRWLSWSLSDEGRSWVKKNLDKWREYFRKNFDKKLDASKLEKMFIRENSKKATLTLEINKKNLDLIHSLLMDIWESFLGEEESDKVPIPPFPPYKPILLVGPPGTGKTSTIYALAWQTGASVIEFNASDKRNKSIIETVVNEATRSYGFRGSESYYPPRIILLDEVDGLDPSEDRGGFSAILKILEKTLFPVALTANVMHDRKVRALMSHSVTVFFNRPEDYQIERLVKWISSKMKFEVPVEVLNHLKKYAPDFRTVVNALEVYYYSGSLPTIFHDQMNSLQDAIRLAFGYKIKSDGKIDILSTQSRVQSILNSVEGVDPWDLILWVWENASSFLEEKNLFPFFDQLARADYLYQIGSRRDNWRVAYRDSLRVLTLAMVKYGKPVSNIWALRRIRINKPSIVEELSKLKSLLEGKDLGEEGSLKKLGLRPLLEKYAKYTHTSRKDAWYELKFLLWIGNNKPEDLGKILARIQVPEETVELFVERFFDKGKRKVILESYKEFLFLSHPKVKKATELPGLVLGREEEGKKKEEDKRESDEETAKRDKKTPRLDEFFK